MQLPPLEIILPRACRKEARWTCEVVFERILGLQVDFREVESDRISLRRSGKTIELSNAFFAHAEKYWLKPESLDGLFVTNWDAREADLASNLLESALPVIAGTSIVRRENPDKITFEFDVLGLIFFLMSRYEECVSRERDSHDRFPASASLLAQTLLRPLADEYIEVLWNAIRQLWPDFSRAKVSSTTMLSCDVDQLFDRGSMSLSGLLRRFGGLLSGKSIAGTYRSNIMNYLRVRREGSDSNAYMLGIDRLIDDACERGLCMTFFFIPTTTDAAMDGDNRPEEPSTRKVIRKIVESGHQVGVHPGYMTYRDPTVFQMAIDHFRTSLAEMGIEPDLVASRQHYLRWSSETTPRLCEDARIDYDSTLGYAQAPGFRCGTAREFPMYDVPRRTPLKCLQRPLILMDSTLLDGRYAKSSDIDEDIAIIKDLARTSRHYGGTFNVLWHNTSFISHRGEEIYQAILAEST